MDRNLNDLLKWSIENSTTATDGSNNGNAATTTTTAATSTTTTTATNGDATTATTARRLDPEALAALLGGPSDADLMKAAMEVVTDPDPSVTLENRLVAFDNFEQLVESLDNANNIANLSLWTPLLSLLAHEAHELRRMAAWCVGTAVQNNAPSQERLLAMGGIPRLVGLATAAGEHDAVRRKAVYALSSAVRNYQPAMDAAAAELARLGHGLAPQAGEKVDANDMDAVDAIMDGLKEQLVAAAATNGTA